MPIAPLNTKCRELGCQNPKTGRSTFCIQHGGGFSEKAKANLKLYGQRVWEKIRASQLSRQPLCGRCQSEGKITAANHVDHVFPHRRDADAFKVNLFQSLCTACHTLKTQDENKGRYLHYTAHGITEYTGDDYIRICANMTR
jgi:5-methylcytosine-specific restriction protein A